MPLGDTAVHSSPPAHAGLAKVSIRILNKGGVWSGSSVYASKKAN
jgi:hypothetical protein